MYKSSHLPLINYLYHYHSIFYCHHDLIIVIICNAVIDCLSISCYDTLHLDNTSLKPGGGNYQNAHINQVEITKLAIGHVMEIWPLSGPTLRTSAFLSPHSEYLALFYFFYAKCLYLYYILYKCLYLYYIAHNISD